MKRRKETERRRERTRDDVTELICEGHDKIMRTQMRICEGYEGRGIKR